MQGTTAVCTILRMAAPRIRRADPCLILPECKSILVLAAPYTDPNSAEASEGPDSTGRIAAYAWGEDYHNILPAKLQELVTFIEGRVGHPVPNRNK